MNGFNKIGIELLHSAMHLANRVNDHLLLSFIWRSVSHSLTLFNKVWNKRVFWHENCLCFMVDYRSISAEGPWSCDCPLSLTVYSLEAESSDLQLSASDCHLSVQAGEEQGA